MIVFALAEASDGGWSRSPDHLLRGRDTVRSRL
jgi:hypothetical protein